MQVVVGQICPSLSDSGLEDGGTTNTNLNLIKNI